MAYLLLILEPHGQSAERTEAEGREAYARMVEYGEGLAEHGLLRTSESLHHDSQGFAHRCATAHSGCSTAPSPRARR